MGKFARVTAPLAFCLVVSDAVMVAVTAWLGVTAAGLPRRGRLEPLLAWLLLALAWIAVSGQLLGLVGGLGPRGFWLVHLLGLAALLAARRSRVRADVAAGVGLLRDWRSGVARRDAAALAGVAAVILLLALAALAAGAEPVVYDAITYRLPRIGAWLQSGRVEPLATDDFRLNYMPAAPDLVIAWLLGATVDGYRFAALSQVAGGALALGATYGLGRLLGLGVGAAAGGSVLLLGMANAGVQFTTLHSDLFTAGVLAAAYFLWHRAWRRGEGSWIGGAGLVLALGSKGTVFYLAPGALLWAGWLILRRPAPLRALGPTVAGGLAAALLVLAPDYARNWRMYGGLLGPREAVVMHHGGPLSVAAHLDKLRLNLGASAVQLLEPHSQPFWLQPAAQAAGRAARPLLRDELDPYLFEAWTRRTQVAVVLDQANPDADVIGCGLPAALLFLAAGALALIRRRREPAAGQVLVWGAGVVIFVLVQHALVQWHQWQFRFLVLAAPWAAALGAWALDRLPRRLAVAGWAVALVSAAQVFGLVQARAHQAGWAATTRPERALSTFLLTQWSDWSAELAPATEPLRVAQPINRPLAAFFRRPPAQGVTFESLAALRAPTAEAAVAGRPGWLVVPVGRFQGAEGRVQGRTWLFNGDGAHPNSVAAFRALAPGEEPAPLLYRRRLQPAEGGLSGELVVRTWKPEISLRLFNPAPAPWHYTIETPLGRRGGTLAPGAETIVTVPIVPDVPAGVAVAFTADPGAARPGMFPAVTLAP